jgi:hypothetical protein
MDKITKAQKHTVIAMDSLITFIVKTEVYYESLSKQDQYKIVTDLNKELESYEESDPQYDLLKSVKKYLLTLGE